jgi:hypothetical protein
VARLPTIFDVQSALDQGAVNVLYVAGGNLLMLTTR